MSPMRKLLLCVGFAAALAACGDNNLSDDAPNIDAAPIPDAEPDPDAYVCPADPPGSVGGACDEAADCDSAPGAGDGSCYVGGVNAVVFPPEGFCVREDTVNFDYCAVDADCGAGAV